MARAKADQFGSIEDVDFDTLIVKNADGSYTYAEPQTVAESYCIMLHKIKETYPDAEIYCFAVVPSSGGYLSTCNTRLKSTYLFNNMVKGVAEYHDAIVVDLLEEFALDPDGDGVAVQEDLDEFKTCFNGDPHPNAKGFDVITKAFVDAVLANTKYSVQVETTAGDMESVAVETTSDSNGKYQKAENYVTESGMIVDYESTETKVNGNTEFEEIYRSTDEKGLYIAEGGSERTYVKEVPGVEVNIPLTAQDDAQTEADETKNSAQDKAADSSDYDEADTKDGIYDYTNKTVKKQGDLSIQTKKISIDDKVTERNSGSLKHVKGTVAAAEGNDIAVTDPVVIPENPQITEGYEYSYIGSERMSRFYSSQLYTHGKTATEAPVYESDEFDLYGQDTVARFKQYGCVVPRIYLGKDDVVEGQMENTSTKYPWLTWKFFPARYASVEQFALVNANGETVTTYCADNGTDAVKNYGYNMKNVDDADYYSKEEAKKIKVVAKNGYWGTESGEGSLGAVKDMMRESGQFTEDEINGLTDGMAIMATQYAILSLIHI